MRGKINSGHWVLADIFYALFLVEHAWIFWSMDLVSYLGLLIDCTYSSLIPARVAFSHSSVLHSMAPIAVSPFHLEILLPPAGFFMLSALTGVRAGGAA
jgi:hypothetical protein